MKKESQNDRNFIVKTAKKRENRQSNSLIKLSTIARGAGHSGGAWTTPRMAPANFQRFERLRVTVAKAMATSISRQYARSGAKMAGGDETTTSEQPSKPHAGSEAGRFVELARDQAIPA